MNSQRFDAKLLLYVTLLQILIYQVIGSQLPFKQRSSTWDKPILLNNSVIDLSAHANKLIVLELPNSFIHSEPLDFINFSVRPPINHGVIVIIQEMNLRTVGNECIDYIKLTASKDSIITCGILNETGSNIIGRRMYIGEEDQTVSITFYVLPQIGTTNSSELIQSPTISQAQIQLSAHLAINTKPTPIIYQVITSNVEEMETSTNPPFPTPTTTKSYFSFDSIDWRWLNRNNPTSTQKPIYDNNDDDYGIETTGWAQRLSPMTVVIIFLVVIFGMFATCHLMAKMTSRHPMLFNRRQTVRHIRRDDPRQDMDPGIMAGQRDIQTISSTLPPYPNEPPPPHSSLFENKP